MIEPQSRTLEYRWGVCAIDEPANIRVIKGYVTVLSRQTSSGAALSYRLIFSDPDGLPISNFSVENFVLFVNAAHLAMKELGLPAGDNPNPSAVLVKLATSA